jgi:uncharacterized protein
MAVMASGGCTVARRRAPRVLELILVLEGAALAILVGVDDSQLGHWLRVVAVVAVTSIGTWYVRRAGRVGRGAAVLAMGIAGIIAGAGIGSAYASSVGMSVITIAGAIALMTGLASAIAAGVILTRCLRGWRRLVVIPAAVVLVVFFVYPLTMAVNATNRPASPLAAGDPSDHGLRYEDVAFPTTDGVQLSGWYVPSRNGAAVVVLHGAGADRSSVVEHGVVLAHHGYGVLLLDTRGHGRSGGDAMDFGWYGPTDILAAVSFLQSRPDVTEERIGVVGISMGGEQAIAAAGVDERIRAVVAEGVTGMQAEDHGWVERYGIQGSFQSVIDPVMYGTAGLLSGLDPPMALRDAIASAAPRPLLLIAGGDTASETVAGEWFEQTSPDSVELWVVPGAGHTAGLATMPAEWETKVIRFLDEALAPRLVEGS